LHQRGWPGAFAVLCAVALCFRERPASAQSGPVASWHEEHPFPFQRVHSTMAYDEGRGRLVLHGGHFAGADESDETWEWDGQRWEPRPTPGPGPRANGRLVYDKGLGEIVLVGGDASPHVTPSDSVWLWDGISWREQATVAPPPPLGRIAATYDDDRGVIVVLTEGPAVWELDTASFTWTHRLFSGGPPTPSFFELVYDPVAKRSLTFAALPAGSPAKTGTWAWNGKAWTFLSESGPVGQGQGMLARDPVRQRLVYTCGSTLAAGYVNKTWEWNGKAWTEVKLPAASPKPSPRTAAALAWDGTTQRLALFGGNVNISDGASMWLYDGSAWERHAPDADAPFGRWGMGAAHDTARAETVVFGGFDGISTTAETWRFGAGWERATPQGASPDARMLHAMAFDSVRQRVVVFGGTTTQGAVASSSILDDTWLWDGDSWVEAKPPKKPQGRMRSAATFDAARGKVVLFGGVTLAPLKAGSALGDLWEWDGEAWAPRDLEPAPQPRYDAAMAYDAARGVTVLYGGTTAGSLVVDMWEYDGSSWTQRTPAERPGPGSSAKMAYDPVRRRVVLLQGDELWEWDGASWTRIQRGIPPGGRESSALVFDEARGRSLLLGGLRVVGMGGADVWSYTTRGEPCSDGALCAAGSCVDGVCCEQAACGLCSSCNVGPLRGECAPRVHGESDASGCAGRRVCDGAGACVSSLGGTCASTADCAFGTCVDGTCCAEASCEGACRSCAIGAEPGVCSAVTARANPGRCAGDRRCDAQGDCKLEKGQPCAGDADCAEARCALGRCAAPGAPICDGENTVLTAEGLTLDCSPYRCTPSGVCLRQCSTSTECERGKRCDDAGRCTADTPTAAAPGCAIGAPGSAGSASSSGSRVGAPPLALLALAAALRRRARRPLPALLPLLPLLPLLLLLLTATPAAAQTGAVWRNAWPSRGAFTEAASAIDTKRSRLLVHGGLASTGRLGETWSLDKKGWRFLSQDGPTPRLQGAMAYDPGDDRAIMFGGRPLDGASAETWEWDGQSWTRSHALLAPPPRYLHAMAYDAKRGSVLLFGGYDGETTWYDDTWEYKDGRWAQWDQGGNLTRPSRRAAHRMAHDAARGVTVLFGGSSEVSPTAVLDDLWEWNGAWTQITLPAGAPRPPARSRGAMTYSPSLGGVVLCGGNGAHFVKGVTAALLGDCWRWDGKAWAQIAFSQGKSLYFSGHELVGDGVFGVVSVAGGSFGVAPNSDIYQQYLPLFLAGSGAGAEWADLTGSASWATPSPRSRHAAAYDAEAGELVMLGGGTTPFPADLGPWRWDGERWLRGSPTGKVPSARTFHSLTWDDARATGVLFGGASAQGVPIDETWLLSGNTFTLLSPAPSPRPKARYGHAAAYQQGRERLVVFGGHGAKGLLADTWEWDGKAWLARTPETSPPARESASVAYDAARDRVVLFGGLAPGGAPLDEGVVWEWDGDTWTAVPSDAGPPPRGDAMAAYDPVRGRVVLGGGAAGPVFRDDLWAWDGAGWEQLGAGLPAMLRSDGTMIFDPQRRRLIIFGGAGPDARLLGDVWERHERGGPCASDDTCHSGHCSEGVCCEEEACPTCSTCAQPGSEGTCTLLPSAAPDPGRCDGAQACDGEGGCLASLGQPCSAGGGCSSGSCVDGVCCASPACDGLCRACNTPQNPGLCSDVLGAEHGACSGERTCSPSGDCLLADARPCTTPDACASGRCEQGQCTPRSLPTCDGEHTMRFGDGTSQSCAPFRCDAAGCLSRCTSSKQCTSGSRCDAQGACVASQLAASSPACSVARGPHGSSVPPASFLAAPFLAAVTLALRSRSRRRPAPGLPRGERPQIRQAPRPRA
jgi:hypothetical protein